MTFNLEKNDGTGSKTDLSKNKEGGSKFDLGKNSNTGSETPSKSAMASDSESSSGKTIAIMGLVALLLAGGGWYFLSGKSADSNSAAPVGGVKNPSAKATPSAGLDEKAAENIESSQKNLESDSAKGAQVGTTQPSSVPGDITSASTQKESAPPVSSRQDASNPIASSSKTSAATSVNSDNTGSEIANKSNNSQTVASSNVAQTQDGRSSQIATESAAGIKKTAATFGKASNEPTAIDEAAINELISKLNENPTARVRIEGYASSEGDVNFNQSLSEKRAKAFRDYLISKGVASGRITAIGKGIADPVASNETESGRQQNRRVEIVIQ